MKYRLLGRTGVWVSEISLGAMTFGGKGHPVFETLGALGQEEVDRVVGTALDAEYIFNDGPLAIGVDGFDCIEPRGHNTKKRSQRRIRELLRPLIRFTREGNKMDGCGARASPTQPTNPAHGIYIQIQPLNQVVDRRLINRPSPSQVGL